MNKSVLVVEDDEAIAEIIAMEIEDLGYNCIKTWSAKKVLTLITKHKPDLILLDILLPDGNGIDIAKKIKGRNLRVPVAFVTAKTGAQDLVDNKIADYLLAKPFNIKDLEKLLKRVLA